MSGRRYYGPRRATVRPRARWLAVKFPATCRVCGRTVAPDEPAFWDGPGTGNLVTCSALPCAVADGLTRDVWHGSPVSGRWAPTLADTRLGGGLIGPPAPLPGRTTVPPPPRFYGDAGRGVVLSADGADVLAAGITLADARERWPNLTEGGPT